VTAPETALAARLQHQLQRLSALQVLQARLRHADPAELPFIAVNETHTVLPFRQALLWLARDDRIAAVSGSATVEPGAPYVQWATRVGRALGQHPLGRVQPSDLPDPLAQDWAEWLPDCVLWCPLRDPRGAALGGLLLARDYPWTEGDLPLAEAIGGGLASAFLLARLPRRRHRPRTFRRPALAVGALALLLCSLLPLPETVLAPAEVVPDQPASLRAPFAGVVEHILVRPNQNVRAGEVLATLDRRQVATAYDVAQKALEASRTEYRQVAQEAVTDPRARSRATLLQSRIEEQQADADYQRTLLDRTTLLAPTDGIAVFNDPVEWVGKPVETGERIMLVAPPASSVVEAQVPAAAMIALEPGANALFFDNLRPDHPARGTVEYAAYASAMTPEGVLAYAVHLRLANDQPARLGLRGTAKLYGPTRPVLLWALRRPIAVIRQWTAF